jgi:hypothetical protein
MDWWTLAKPFVEAPTLAITFALTVGNTGWLIHQARKAKAEDSKRAATEEELNQIVQSFVRNPTHVRSIWHGTNDLHMDAAVLGLTRGVLRGFWDDGKLHLVLATVEGEKAEARAKTLLREFHAQEEAELPKVLELVAQHGAEFFEVPPALRGGALLAFRRKLVRYKTGKGSVYISGLPASE